LNRVIQEDIRPGVTIVAENLPNFYSFSLGIFIKQGSRDELSEENGITHLIEHMLFKGTSRRSSLEIVKLIEGLGGSFDAFTTKENLVIVTKFLSEHIVRVFDLILEVLLDSKVDENDLNKEKLVVLEEIKSDNDDPSDCVFDLLFRTLYPEHPMGLPIAGTTESVQKIDAQKAKNHYHQLLQRKIVIAISGNFDYPGVFNLAQKRFSYHNLIENIRESPDSKRERIKVQKKSEVSQVHITFGIPAVPYSSPLRHPLLALNTSFGGGMSSRLFQGLREKEGLVYDVHSFIDLYVDCGLFGFYFTCDKSNLKNVAQELKNIFRTLHTNGFANEEIDIAKTYITGNLLLSLEGSTNRMLRLGREILYLHKVTSVDEVVNKIKSVSADNVNELIPNYLDPMAYSIAAVGPVTEDEIGDFFNSIKV